jgi:hypothetical protein
LLDRVEADPAGQAVHTRRIVIPPHLVVRRSSGGK